MSSIYIHIPFCRHKCYYCDFPIAVIKSPQLVEDYVNALCQEILSLSTPKPLDTIFFGGGTPSLLPVEYLKHILTTVIKHLNTANNPEISLEIDPGTFGKSQLETYINLGINRFSLGVQAFQEELLEISGRSHSLQETYTAINLLKQCSVDNFSIDLISGLPHQTLAQWENSLSKVVEVQPRHVSCYDLVIEEKTVFGRQYQAGGYPLPPDDTTAEMYRIAQKYLTTNGYQHYEISNYAQSGYQCRHNRVYWENRSYLACGMGAASYTEGRRFTRPAKFKDYIDWVNQGAIIEAPMVNDTDRILETLMLGLRLAEGVKLTQFSIDTKEKILNCLKPYQTQGWVVVTPERVFLTDPEGFLFSNTVLATLFQKVAP